MDAKIQALSTTGSQPKDSYQPIVITESEANAYLKEHGPEFMPLGVGNVELHIQPDKVSGAADVDFDELNSETKNSNDVGAQLVAWVFKGKQRLAATGKLSTENRQGKLSIENVTVGSTALPDWLVQWVLDNYLQKRYNIDLSKPFALPDHVTSIELASGQATFVRSPKKAAASSPQ